MIYVSGVCSNSGLSLSLYQSCFSSSQSHMLMFIAAQLTGRKAKEWLNVKGYIHVTVGKKKVTYRQTFKELTIKIELYCLGTMGRKVTF